MEYNKWTQSAIECYSRQCICTDCPTKKLLETPCRMKKCVMELLEKFGEPPNFMTDDIFPELSEKQRQIIEAIVQGATTTKEIALKLNTNTNNATTYLNQLYKKTENLGYRFKKNSGKLPEFITFINQIEKGQ